ncbi:hypothetical protein B0A79_13895 [Flavobacterium piscis]|uniref:Uncharacterized protein n=1 Tax=Flavobacterium piscis TaxID=1114874 RepID=A0ABX2XF96_9FLAO|nr:hypothetical protein [Flavobacterium piscis]OCB70737.1 hypothetical protein FLP_18915 [Flavobacterium piscis]OXG03484.1 hypothetical protein B0A79_13895 [Flavobacterium piscis]
MTNNNENELSKSLAQTLSESDLTKIGIDIAEISIDSILENGVLKDLPIVGSLIGIWKTGVAVNDYRFLNKMMLFLKESSILSESNRKKIIEDLEDSEYQSEVGEKLIAIIDKLETGSKAKLLGKTLALFGNKIITKDEFWRVAFIIERLPMSDIIALKNWKTIELNIVEDIRRHLYLSVGIGWFVINMSSTGFCWQERLCEIFGDYLVD